MARPPLKIRVDLRDHWENENSPVQKSIAALSQLLGLPVSINLEASMLWADLENYFPDQATFIPSIAGVVKAWTDCLAARLENDANAAWTEQLLELVNQGGRVLRSRIKAATGSRVGTALAATGATFTIAITEAKPPYGNLSSFFATDFEKLFAASTNKILLQSQPVDDQEWANINLPSRTRDYSQIVSTSLPRLDTLACPEVLFESQVPYHMIVKIIHDGVRVHGSHQGSLELLAGYLQKYGRMRENITVKLPILKVELQNSHFGYGVLFDSVSITPTDERASWPTVNPVLILSFVESVLGYSPASYSGGENQWYFRRDIPFNS